jgi:hypothetical protein
LLGHTGNAAIAGTPDAMTSATASTATIRLRLGNSLLYGITMLLHSATAIPLEGIRDVAGVTVSAIEANNVSDTKTA